MACAFYRGGYRYCFNATPHHCARHQRCGQSPPQGHPNTTLLGFRVALRRRAGLKNYMFGATCHHATIWSYARKRNVRQQLQDERLLSTLWHALASGPWTACAGLGPATKGRQKRHRNKPGRGQEGTGQEGPGRGPEEASRGQEEARKRPGRGQEEDRAWPEDFRRGRRTSGAAGGFPHLAETCRPRPVRPEDFRV